jgi:cytoskeleton protein RodZ
MALFERLKTPFAEDPSGSGAVGSGESRLVGDVLRQRREGLGLDLGQIAVALRIKPAYLAALEEGRLDQLPGAAYAAGFMRAYAEHLGLDGAEMSRRFKIEAAGLDAKPDLSFPMPLGERGVPGGTVLLVALILAICGYGTWYYLPTGERSRPERVTEVPASLLPPEPVQPQPAPPRAPAPADAREIPAAAAAAPATPSAASAEPGSPIAPPGPAAPPPSSSPGATAVLVMPALAGSAAPAAAAVDPPIAPPPQRDEQPVYGAAGEPARIVMRAVADSWIQVRDADRSVLFTRLLKAGESYRVPERPGISMRVGNAGGLEILVDGKTAPMLGPPGAVRRDVALDPERLMAGTAVRE